MGIKRMRESVEDAALEKLVEGVANKGSTLAQGLKSRALGTPQMKNAEEDYMEKQWSQMGLGTVDIAREQDADVAKLRTMMDAQKGAAVQGKRDRARAEKAAEKNAQAMHKAQVAQMIHANNQDAQRSVAGIKASAIRDTRKGMENKAKKELEGTIGQNLNLKQKAMLKMATYAAGKKAINVLAGVAEELARRAERGGAMGFVIIACTYLVALIKDVCDIPGVALPGLGYFTGAIGIMNYIFWMMMAGSSHSFLMRWAVKLLMRLLIFIFIDGTPLFGFLPLFLVMNAWNHWDYLKEIKKAERQLAEVNDQIGYVQRDMRRTASSF